MEGRRVRRFGKWRSNQTLLPVRVNRLSNAVSCWYCDCKSSILNEPLFLNSMADDSKKRDIGWNYSTQGATKDSVNCNFCGSTFNGGITRHKQHLVGGFKNVKQCTACPSEIREEVRAYMQNKIANNPKFQVRQPEEYIDIDDVDGMDEYAGMMPPSKTPKISSSGGASSTARNVTKGPMNLYFLA
ncbi:hypothetical protein H5410_002691 [Solanum commersonii]|uniref:BED-type domain-containing protein n=1 Tax=Solanum commersonii TaxID=4109 RepID=A0A9J6B2N2_SOLCO|nr:hypothetical protein H5410_002691 [Solanum commersonii]